MKFLTSQQMKLCEKKVITDLASSLRLIDSAANACAKECEFFGAVCVFCGKGNNGADGYRLALLLRRCGAQVRVVPVLEPHSEECRLLARRCAEEGVPVVPFAEAMAGGRVPRCDAVVDAIFGIGIRGEVTGPAREAIELINRLDAYVIAVDIPSGLDADSGRALGAAVRADKTVTFTAPKAGMISGESADYCGDIVIAGVGVPLDDLPASDAPSPLTAELAASLLPQRPRFSHKGVFGRALLAVGSEGMLGAAALAAKSALRSGAGLVNVICKKGLENTLNIMAPEAVVLPLADYSAASEELGAAAASATALLVGCGLGKSASAAFVTGLLSRVDAPAVLDADGINALAGRPGLLAGRELVLTPHPLEFSRLTGRPVAEIEADRLRAARDFALEYGVTLALKGARTVVAAPTGETWVSLVSTSALAKAGSGDVLAGLICALLAQGLAPAEAACLGVYLHSRAGVAAGRLCGEFSATAADILDGLKYAFTEVTAHARKGLGRD